MENGRDPQIMQTQSNTHSAFLRFPSLDAEAEDAEK
jgi:hypothetical protein